jgi:Ca-activated chloride channel family protein
MIRFAAPWALALLVLPPLLVWLAWRRQRMPRLAHPAAGPLAAAPASLRQRARIALPLLRLACLSLCVLALARPQWGVEMTRVDRSGISIAMLVDVSSSMSALDLELAGRRSDRLAVVKATLEDFVRGDGAMLAGRDGDAIGIITFARYADALSTMTLDHEALLTLLDDIEIVTLPDEDGTAVGDALMLGIDQLRRLDNGSRVLVLLTDGSHNTGAAEPLDAAMVARALGIRVYTVGAGTRGQALMPMPGRNGTVDYVPAEVDIDEAALQQIADLTGGRYFRATDGAALHAIYGEIDRLEKGTNVLKYYQHHREAFPLVIGAALALLLLETTLATTWLRALP